MSLVETYHVTDPQAELIHGLVASHCQAIKNWMASAVERRDYARAESLVDELRQYEELFKKFNVRVHREIESIRRAV